MLHPRVKIVVFFDSNKESEAIILKTDIFNQASVLEKYDRENKNVNVEYFQFQGENVVIAHYVLSEDVEANNFLVYLKNNIIGLGKKGIITFHYCPDEGTFKDWLGCSDDPRAKYEVIKWP